LFKAFMYAHSNMRITNHYLRVNLYPRTGGTWITPAIQFPKSKVDQKVHLPVGAACPGAVLHPSVIAAAAPAAAVAQAADDSADTSSPAAAAAAVQDSDSTAAEAVS
jgi:hypothetical protein